MEILSHAGTEVQKGRNFSAGAAQVKTNTHAASGLTALCRTRLQKQEAVADR